MAGSGSVENRGKGSWRLTVSLGLGADGKYIKKRKTVKAKNKTEAKLKLAAFITELEAGEYIDPSNIKFGQFVQVWRDKYATRKLAPKTIEMYDYQLEGHILPLFRNRKLDEILPIHITDYLQSLETKRNDGKEGGLSTSTIQKHYNILQSIFKYAKKNNLIKHNPVENAEKPTVRYKPGDVYDSEELIQLYHLLSKEQNTQQVLIIKLALNTGMRKGEILALQWDDIDFTTNTIHVRHSLSYTKANGYELKDPKTKGSNRKVAPPKKLMDELKKHIYKKKTDRMESKELWEGGKHYFVFSSDLGKPLHQNVPSKWWSRFIERVNKNLKDQDMPTLKKIRFHDLRHTAATSLINKGADPHSISKRLGHANIKTTFNIYGHYLEEADQRIADLLNEDYI